MFSILYNRIENKMYYIGSKIGSTTFSMIKITSVFKFTMDCLHHIQRFHHDVIIITSLFDHILFKFGICEVSYNLYDELILLINSKYQPLSEQVCGFIFHTVPIKYTYIFVKTEKLKNYYWKGIVITVLTMRTAVKKNLFKFNYFC